MTNTFVRTARVTILRRWQQPLSDAELLRIVATHRNDVLTISPAFVEARIAARFIPAADLFRYTSHARPKRQEQNRCRPCRRRIAVRTRAHGRGVTRRE